jgi:cell division protein FtsL
MTMAFGSAYWEGYRLRREAAELIREREQLRRENAQLREEVRLLNTPEYIERIAREQLGLVRPGEIAIMLVRATPAPAPTRRRTDQPSQRPPEHESWWIRLLQR